MRLLLVIVVTLTINSCRTIVQLGELNEMSPTINNNQSVSSMSVMNNNENSNMATNTTEKSNMAANTTEKSNMSASTFEKSSMTNLTIDKAQPESVNQSISEVSIEGIQIQRGMREIQTNGQTTEIFVREVIPASMSKGDLLFLHGARFSSANWENIRTLQIFGALGYRTVAIDIPGFGRSPRRRYSDVVTFMKSVITSLELNSPVIVSPSMSGSFSLPLLISAPETLSAYVALAPVIPHSITDEQFKTVKVPTLILYGDRDRYLGIGQAPRLRLITPHVEHILKGGHPVYLERPMEFHEHFLDFLRLYI